MAQEWKRHDDVTEYVTLGNTLPVCVVYDRAGSPGYKVRVGKRALRDKLPSKEAAKQVALAFAQRVLSQCLAEAAALSQASQSQGAASKAGKSASI